MKARRDANHASTVEGTNAAISAWTAHECNKALGQELSAEEDKSHGKLVRAAKEMELAARGKFKVPKLLPKATVDARWVLVWEMVASEKDGKACPADEGYQGTDFENGLVETSTRVSLLSSHTQVLSQGAPKVD